MKTIHLPRLDLEFLAHDGVYFHDDGLVEDVGRHSDEVLEKYGLEPYVRSWEDVAGRFEHVSIFYHAYQADPEIHYHIFVRSNLHSDVTMFCQGHEETHVLFQMGKICLLKDALDDGGIQSEGLELLPEEAICDIGGTQALLHTNPEWDSLDFSNCMTDYIAQVAEWLEPRSNLKIGYAGRK